MVCDVCLCLCAWGLGFESTPRLFVSNLYFFFLFQFSFFCLPFYSKHQHKLKALCKNRQRLELITIQITSFKTNLGFEICVQNSFCFLQYSHNTQINQISSSELISDKHNNRIKNQEQQLWLTTRSRVKSTTTIIAARIVVAATQAQSISSIGS